MLVRRVVEARRIHASGSSAAAQTAPLSANEKLSPVADNPARNRRKPSIWRRLKCW